MIRTLAVATVATAAVLGTGAAATAVPGAAAATIARPRTELVVSYQADAGFAAAVVLRCQPAGGAHPRAARACATLRRVDGRPARLRPARVYCTMEYAPVVAEIRGTWRGRAVSWSRRFGNMCELHRVGGPLFRF